MVDNRIKLRMYLEFSGPFTLKQCAKAAVTVINDEDPNDVLTASCDIVESFFYTGHIFEVS